MSNEVDSVLEGLTDQELKDTIVKNVKEIRRLKEDGKAYAKGVREMVKVLDDRNSDALDLLEERKHQTV